MTSTLPVALALALCVGLLAASSPVLAEPGGPPSSDVPAIPHERYTLPNGLEVILHKDSTVPLVAVDVWYHVGSGCEEPGRSGFAHLFEHMMFQGARHIGEDVHFDVLREVGASSINGSTTRDRTNYFEVVPSHQLETALWLESDRMGYLLDMLNDASFANQRDVVRNERRQNYDTRAYGQARFVIAAELYPEGHPYRYLTIGRHEDLEAATVADVTAFFKQWYVPSNATLTIAGDFDVEATRALINKWFGSFPALPRPSVEGPAPPSLATTVRVELDDPFAKLTRVEYVWLSPKMLGEGDQTLDLLADVLGASGWGRLDKLLVTDKQLARSVSVYQSGAGFNGELHVAVNLAPSANLAEVEGLLQAELDRVMAEPVDAAQLTTAVNAIESGYVWGLESVLRRAEQLQFFNHFKGDPGWTSTYIERYRAVTPAMIQQVAKEVLSRPRVEVISKPAGGAR